MTQQKDVFLSHARDDGAAHAKILKDHLVANGVSAFLDVDDLYDLRDVQRHIAQSKLFVVVLSPLYLTRAWCLVELYNAFLCDMHIVIVDVRGPQNNSDLPPIDAASIKAGLTDDQRETLNHIQLQDKLDRICGKVAKEIMQRHHVRVLVGQVAAPVLDAMLKDFESVVQRHLFSCHCPITDVFLSHSRENADIEVVQGNGLMTSASCDDRSLAARCLLLCCHPCT